MKVVQVCKSDKCDNKPTQVKVGKVLHTFCCDKGFQKSLSDFLKSIKK